MREFLIDFNENCQKAYIAVEYVAVNDWRSFAGGATFVNVYPTNLKFIIKILDLVGSKSFYCYNTGIYAGQQPEG